MDEHDDAADLIKRLGAQQGDGIDVMAQQMRERLRAKVAGKPVQRLNYAGYEDPELIGEGGMGRVYRAHDPHLDRPVAIKLVRVRQPLADLRLRHEAQTMARIDHPNVVQVFDAGRLEDGQTFLAMQFVAGHDLRAWCQHKSRTWRAIRDVFCKAGRGLEAAHRAGIVHRDFKPKSRRPSQTAPQPTDRPHSRKLGRFERVAVFRVAPPCPHVPQVLAKRWQPS